MMELYNRLSEKASQLVTGTYSTSFSMGTRALHPSLRWAIHGIYGFVRLADEIVDSFHGHDQQALLREFKEETYRLLERGISTNPVLQTFGRVVRKYQIPIDLIEAFFFSMEEDLHRKRHDDQSYRKYVYGSAEAVGLMCLCVFTEGDRKAYELLKPHAQSLGAAFQKVNFLRDVQNDWLGLGRRYFPRIDLTALTEADIAQIGAEIERDFQHAFIGIRQLPARARLGVLVAYTYYRLLLKKILSTQPRQLLQRRIRVSNLQKWYYFLRVYLWYSMKKI